MFYMLRCLLAKFPHTPPVALLSISQLSMYLNLSHIPSVLFYFSGDMFPRVLCLPTPIILVAPRSSAKSPP